MKISTADLIKDRLPNVVSEKFDDDVVLAYTKEKETHPPRSQWLVVQAAYYNRFPEKYEGWVQLQA